MDNIKRMSKVMEEYREKGFCILRGEFSSEEIEVIKRRMDEYVVKNPPGIVYEGSDEQPRGLHGMHLYDELFDKITKDKRLLNLAEGILNDTCYVHQFKINVKAGVVGQAWPWHQDFIFWSASDGIKSNRLVNVGLLIDDVNMESGPLSVIPSSHRKGNLTDIHIKSKDWQGDLSKELTYQVGPDRIDELIAENGIEYIVGKAGDVILFDPDLVHSSSANMSPHNRAFMILTYNAMSNAPNVDEMGTRPEFISAKRFEPLSASLTNDYFYES